MNLSIKVIPVEEERPSLKAFKAYLCNKYRVKNVNDIPISINEYADLMQVFEAGYQAKEQEIVDKVIEKCTER